MKVEYAPIAELGPGPAAEVLAQAFADYVVKIPFTEAMLRQMMQLDSVDLAQSLVVRLDGEPVGAALIARRGPVSRLAGMAFVPVARRRGLGRALMERLISDARARGDRRMVLEVIEENTAAVRLYEEAGFKPKRRLMGFAGPAPDGLVPEPKLAATSLCEVAAAMSRLDAAVDWPWQISGETIAHLPPPARGYTLDGAWIAVVNPAGPTAGFRALAVEGGADREKRAGRLLRAVMARHPAKEWRMSALWPEELAGWFAGSGLGRHELTQWQMIRNL
jgi:ribosomal protein S18 acetylase RimI-like enzyme